MIIKKKFNLLHLDLKKLMLIQLQKFLKEFIQKKYDVYSFALIVYEFLTNEVLFKGCNQF